MGNSKDKKYGIAIQSAFGTAIADNAAVIELDCEDTNIDPDFIVRRGEGAHGSRNRTYQDTRIDTHGAMPKLSMTLYALKDQFDLFLAAFFQNVSEGATTPFAKTFTPHATEPDFSSDAGYFFTIFEYNPETGTTWKITDAVISKLTVTCAQRDMLKLQVEWVGRGLTSFTSDPTGTWTRSDNELTTDYFHWEDISTATINFGAGAQAVTFINPIELSFQHDVVGKGHASGQVTNYALVNRAYTFKLPIDKDAQAESALVNYAGDTAVTVSLRWGAGTADGDVTFDFTGKIETAPTENGDIQSQGLTGSILAPNTSTTPITIIEANAIDRTW